MSLQFPSSPTTGQTFPSPLVPGQPSWVWDSQKWTSRGLANAMVSTSPLPPLNPRVGDLWFDPVEGNTYVYFDDGNSQQWVVTINQTTSFATLPYMSSQLTNDVNTTAQAFITVLQLDIGNEGTWLVSGQIVWLNATAGDAGVYVHINAASSLSSGIATVRANTTVQMSISGIVANPTGSLILTLMGSTAGVVKYNYSGSTNDTQLTAVRIA